MFQIIRLFRQDILALGILAAMVTWFCHEIIFLAQIPFFRDLSTYFYPIKFSVSDAFRSGSMPLWDTRFAAGFPMMAGLQSAVFYPPSLAYFFLPFFAALRFTFAFHYGVAVVGAYVLFRSWKISVSTSLIGAISFSFAGTLVSFSNLLNHFQSAVWLPWLLYSWEQGLRATSWRNIVPFGCIALCQASAGSPEIFLLSIGLLLVDSFRLGKEQRPPQLTTIVSRTIIAGGMVLGVGMIQWLPTAELVMHSRRDQAIHISEALSWSLRPVGLIGIVFPTLEPDAAVTVGIRLIFAESVPFLMSLYIGVVGIIGVGIWLCMATSRERVIVLMAFTASLILALGSFTPVYPFLYEWLPAFRIVRFPEKYWYLAFSLTVFIIVRGIQLIDERRTASAPWMVAISVFAGYLMPYLVFRLRPGVLAELVTSVPDETPLLANSQTIATIFFLLEKQLALAFAVAATLGLYRMGLLRRGLFGLILAIVLFVDLSSVTRSFHFLRDQSIFKTTERILEDPAEERGRLFYYPPGENLHPSFMKVGGRPTYEKATEIALNNLLPNAGILYGFEYFQDIDALSRRSYTDFLMFINALPEERRGKLLRALNVKYVVAFHALKLKELSLVREFPEHYSVLYKVRDPAPRAYIVGRSSYRADVGATLEQMSSDEFDPTRDVVFDRPISLKSRSPFSGEARIRSYEHRRVVIDAQLSDSGVLVLTDAFYPGWKAFVDGNEKKIHRANLLFRGVELSAGTHVVEFIYDPLSFKVGLVVSLCTVIGLIALMIVSSLRSAASSLHNVRSG